MLKELLKQRAEIDAQIAVLQEQSQAVTVDIEHLLAEQLHSLRQMQGKEYGTVNLLVEGVRVAEVVPKQVSWDQDKLNEIFIKIMSAGDKPSDYMRMKLEVPEKQYEAFPPQIKEVFADCRTVKPGKAKLTFTEESNA